MAAIIVCLLLIFFTFAFIFTITYIANPSSKITVGSSHLMLCCHTTKSHTVLTFELFQSAIDIPFKISSYFSTEYIYLANLITGQRPCKFPLELCNADKC